MYTERVSYWFRKIHPYYYYIIKKKYTVHITQICNSVIKSTITLYWDETYCRVCSIKLINGLCESVFFQPHSLVVNIFF